MLLKLKTLIPLVGVRNYVLCFQSIMRMFSLPSDFSLHPKGKHYFNRLCPESFYIIHFPLCLIAPALYSNSSVWGFKIPFMWNYMILLQKWFHSNLCELLLHVCVFSSTSWPEILGNISHKFCPRSHRRKLDYYGH